MCKKLDSEVESSVKMKEAKTVLSVDFNSSQYLNDNLQSNDAEETEKLLASIQSLHKDLLQKVPFINLYLFI